LIALLATRASPKRPMARAPEPTQETKKHEQIRRKSVRHPSRDQGGTMTPQLDPEVVAWVSSHVIPFEAELRAKLRRICASAAELDDLVQDIYYRILKLDSVQHIRDPKAFLMQTAKNIVVDRLRRDAIVNIEAVACLDELNVADSAPTPERVAVARAELKWALGLVANLPERCKKVFRARKIYGLSQHETAETLGLTENVVEKETMKGLKLISDMVARVGLDEDRRQELATAKARAKTRAKTHHV
jgi:RNA polymerase sigma-70 factor (ECF subfamily)